MVHSTSLFYIKKLFFVLLASFFLYLIWASLYTIREGAISSNNSKFLGPNEVLNVNQYRVSSNKQYFLIMQDNGNLAIFKGSDPSNPTGNPIWSTSAQGNGSVFYAIMQNDGVLAVYQGTPTNNSGQLWSSDPTGDQTTGDYVAILGDTGILSVFKGSDPNTIVGDSYWNSLSQIGLDNIVDVSIMDQTNIDSLTSKFKTETREYDTDVVANTALKDKVQEQADKLIAGMEINNNITSELSNQRLRNQTLIAKLKAKDVELAAFEKHIKQLQAASYANKVNTELNGSVVFPKQVMNQ